MQPINTLPAIPTTAPTSPTLIGRGVLQAAAATNEGAPDQEPAAKTTAPAKPSVTLNAPIPLLSRAAVAAGASVGVRQKLRARESFTDKGESGCPYEYLGRQPSSSLLPGLPEEMRQSRLGVALLVESAYVAKAAAEAKAARLEACGRRETWRPDYEAMVLADLFVAGGELNARQSLIHDEIIDLIRVSSYSYKMMTPKLGMHYLMNICFLFAAALGGRDVGHL